MTLLQPQQVQHIRFFPATVVEHTNKSLLFDSEGLKPKHDIEHPYSPALL